MSGIATFIIMFVFWVALSGMFDAFHLTMGLISCAIVTGLSRNLLFWGAGDQPWLKQFLGMMAYLPWLFWAIIVACIDVARIVLSPRMLDLIDPGIVHFKTRLKGEFSRVTFAQSITLTPGTITVFTNKDEFTVYALTKASAESLPGEMEERIIKALESHL
ncbi:MAG TPA: Na+/H+ antiporter subunit E [Deltaproteobacteria bacterium]|nr:Na+/H+ antiporter subunit E [Deltaproteobacteria bacterium]HQB39123.1 Na+/H+ antiporter subunit E [Deltaproteobacteria bacterium]